MKSKEAIQQLMEQSWLRPLALQHCPFISKMKTPPTAMFFTEVTVRIPTEEVTRFGKPKPQRRRFDAIALVKPHFKAYGDDLFALGIEVKVSKSDLSGDMKFTDYLAYCDYFAFAVPTELLAEARRKIHDRPAVGLINAHTGEWEVMPKQLEMTPECATELYRQLAFSARLVH